MADKQQPTGELTLIAGNTLFEGKIKTEGSIRIDGKFVGEVTAKANAAVGSSGTIEGNLSARNVTVAGKISGTVQATEKLVLESKSIVQGDIRAARLVVDEGATFDGRCDMKQAGSPAPSAPKKE
ncbi:MAG: polymer-forming cytoskeletal protein [Ignavibacteriae bacterium]|nr:polymer-forming cytoskeletal protein [Ignavibacteriota bacterium]